MNKRMFVYNLINIFVLLATALIFVFSYITTNIFVGISWEIIAVLTVTVIIVNFLKAFRLYFALYDSDIGIYGYSKIYCKVTPISILFPFKIGEFFRMFCYGYAINNMLKGTVTVVLDRFMDTIALITMIIVVSAVTGGEMIIPLVYLLIGFLAVAVLLFLVFPGAYKYWRKYLLRADGTPLRIAALKLLENINLVYAEISNITKGRGIILYVISILAWATEMGCVALLNRISEHSNLTEKMSSYLASALSTSKSIELKQFIFISVIFLIVIYVFVKLMEVVRGERK